MADVTILDVSNGTAYDSETTSSITVASATQTVPCDNGKETKLALVVINGDSSSATVTVTAPSTDGGVRKALGNYAHTVAAGKTYIINLSDTARYKDLSDNDIDVTVTTEGTIDNIDLYAIQM